MFRQEVLFTKEECIEILNQIEEVKSAQIISTDGTSRYDKSFRKSKVSHSNSDKVKDIILPKISYLYSPIISLPKSLNIVKYTKGDYFKKHQDRLNKNSYSKSERIKTIVIQLSEETYDGGILKVWQNDDVPHIISTELGNITIFDSIYYHEVTTILKGERYALVCWLHQDNLKNIII